MKDETKYLIYRSYSEEERPSSHKKDRMVYYGWTSSKSVIKAFFEQRDKKKYKFYKISMGETRIPDDLLEYSRLIDFVKLKSAATNEEFPLFMTSYEMKQAEHQIQEYFNDLCRLVERDDGRSRLLELYINIDEYYLDPLQYIGFNPPEMEALFDSVEYRECDDSCYDIDALIESRCNAAYDAPYEVVTHTGLIPGFSSTMPVSKQILYSLENFIKVLREDL